MMSGVSVERSHVAPGLWRIDAGPFYDNNRRWGPIFSIPFPLGSCMSLPKEAQECVWALQQVMHFVNTKPIDAYVTKEVQNCDFACRMDQRDRIFIVERASGADPLMSEPHPELCIQIRILNATANGVCVPYCVVMAYFPVIFSLRRAVHATLLPGHRGAGDVDIRRLIWTKLRTHITLQLWNDESPDFDMDAAMGDAVNPSLDWIHDKFTGIFSIAQSVAWIKNHFFKTCPTTVSSFALDGFGILDRAADDNGIDPTTYYSEYDKSINKMVKPLESKQKRRKLNDNGNATGSGSGDEDEVAYVPIVPPSWNFGGGGDALMPAHENVSGFPVSMCAVRVAIPVSVGRPIELSTFCHNMGALPLATCMQILCSRIGNADFLLSQPSDKISAQDCAAIINGKKLNERSMLCNGDLIYATHSMKCLSTSSVEDRLPHLQKYMDVSFLLAASRMEGSDGYTNERAAVYAKCMQKKEESEKACSELFNSASRLQNQGMGCPCWHAAQYVTSVLENCNNAELKLRPGNMELMFMLIIQQCCMELNYCGDGGVFEGAENGIGGTVIVMDGGKHYSSMVIDNYNEAYNLLLIMRKNRGCGADTVTNCFKSMTHPRTYMTLCTLPEYMIEMKTSSTQGMTDDFCHRRETAPGIPLFFSMLFWYSFYFYTWYSFIFTTLFWYSFIFTLFG